MQAGRFSRRRLLAGASALAALPAWAQLDKHAERPALPLAPAAQGDRRVALVIGNAEYSVKPLRNAVNDARNVAEALREIGFRLVTRENATLAAMIDAMKSFWLRSRQAEVRVVYYAGHGMQYRGRNFLLPVDTVIEREEDLPRKAAAVDDVVDKIVEGGRGVNIVILDACRTPPTSTTRTRALGSRPLRGGLAQVVAPQGTLVAFSTSPGAVAYDGTDGSSPYTRHLVEQLRVPGQPVEQMFKRVRAAVTRETGAKQVPWETSSLMGDFCFRAGADGRCPSA